MRQSSRSRTYKRPKPYRGIFAVRLRQLMLAGYQSIDDVAQYFDVPPSRITQWRQAHPEFDEAFKVALMDANIPIVEEIYAQALDGDSTMLRYWADRRISAFRPKQDIDHTSNGRTLTNLLSEHGEMDEAELQARGLVAPDDDDADAQSVR